MNEHSDKLHLMYTQVGKVWNFGSDGHKQLASQMMDDIVKILKFAPRYKPENLAHKVAALEKAVSTLLDDYAAYSAKKQQDEYEQVVQEYGEEEDGEVVTVAPEIKKELEPEVKPEIKIGKRGGARPGAGRKPSVPNAVLRKVSIVLPAEVWAEIDRQIEGAEIKSLADHFKQLAMKE